MKNDLINTSLSLLGLKARDRVTGFHGMVFSVTFDAYGCVQALITPPYVDNKAADAMWFDVKRIEPAERLMVAPDFGVQYGEERGGNSLPFCKSMPVPR